MPDLNVEKAQQHLRTLVWGAVLGAIACVAAVVVHYTGGPPTGNYLVDDPGRAIFTGFIIGAGAHELKLWIGRKFTGRQ